MGVPLAELAAWGHSIKSEPSSKQCHHADSTFCQGAKKHFVYPHPKSDLGTNKSEHIEHSKEDTSRPLANFCRTQSAARSTQHAACSTQCKQTACSCKLIKSQVCKTELPLPRRKRLSSAVADWRNQQQSGSQANEAAIKPTHGGWWGEGRREPHYLVLRGAPLAHHIHFCTSTHSITCTCTFTTSVIPFCLKCTVLYDGLRPS